MDKTVAKKGVAAAGDGRGAHNARMNVLQDCFSSCDWRQEHRQSAPHCSTHRRSSFVKAGKGLSGEFDYIRRNEQQTNAEIILQKLFSPLRW